MFFLNYFLTSRQDSILDWQPLYPHSVIRCQPKFMLHQKITPDFHRGLLID
jgi:hypothetical protein